MTKSEGKTALVLMPFNKEYDDIYVAGIKEVLEERGYHCTRVDEEFFSGQIIDEIRRSITASDVIVAEMTDRNPNVYYEVGYAHGVEKYTILITKDEEKLPFDLRGYKHIVYKGALETLRRELDKNLAWFEEASSAAREIRRDPTKLRSESQAVLIHLHNAGENRPAVECAERAKGLSAVLNDLKFQGYIEFYGPLFPNTAIHLTEIGKEAGRKLLEQSRDV